MLVEGHRPYQLNQGIVGAIKSARDRSAQGHRPFPHNQGADRTITCDRDQLAEGRGAFCHNQGTVQAGWTFRSCCRLHISGCFWSPGQLLRMPCRKESLAMVTVRPVEIQDCSVGLPNRRKLAC